LAFPAPHSKNISFASFQDSIDTVIRDIHKLLKATKEAFPESRLRVSFVGYRDYGEDVVIIDFSEDFSSPTGTFVTRLKNVRASGGGDAPEDIFTGFEKVAELSWRSQGRKISKQVLKNSSRDLLALH
jgi:hypothetical protein